MPTSSERCRSTTSRSSASVLSSRRVHPHANAVPVERPGRLVRRQEEVILVSGDVDKTEAALIDLEASLAHL